MPSITSRKSTSIITTLGDYERGDGVMRACGIIGLVLLAASFALDLIVVMDFSRPYQIAQFSQDEYWFMEEIYKLQGHILALDWTSIRGFGSPFAYGFPFWLFAALVALPLHGHVMLMALFLRLIFMAMKYGAFYIVYRRIFIFDAKAGALAAGGCTAAGGAGFCVRRQDYQPRISDHAAGRDGVELVVVVAAKARRLLRRLVLFLRWRSKSMWRRWA